MPRTLTIEEFDLRDSAPKSLTLEQFDAREAASETPSAMDELGQSFKAAGRGLYGGYLGTGAATFQGLANIPMLIRGAGPVPGRETLGAAEKWLREAAQELYGESLEYMDEGTLAAIYRGLGGAPGMVAELVAATKGFRLAGVPAPAVSPGAFGTVEVVRAAEEEPEEIALAGARGASLGKFLEVAAPLARTPRVAALATAGGAPGVAAGDIEEAVAGGVTLGMLGAMGGPGPARGRAPRPPRTATPDTILELTERARPEPPPSISVAPRPVRETLAPELAGRPTTPPPSLPTAASAALGAVPPEAISPVPRAEPSTLYTARAIRETEGAPMAPGRPAERGEPFERPQAPVERAPASVAPERTFAPEAPPAPPKGKPRTLAAYLQSKGGLNDVGGDVRAALDRRNIMPGLINKNITFKDPLKVRQTSKRGMSLDDAASEAQQDGWFPELRHRTAGPDDMIDALRREQAGEILDHPANAEHIRYQEDIRAFEESEYARERAFDAEIERQVKALDYDTSDFPFEETPSVPARLTEEAGLVGRRPEEAARIDPDAGARGAAAREVPEWAQVTSLLPRLPDGTIPIPLIERLFDILPSGKTRWSDLTDAEKITLFDSAKKPTQSTTELTEQGQQIVLPGAERTTGKEFIEAQADKRIKGTAAQKPADEGLFDVAGRGETDLLTFPGPLPALKQQWHRTATEIIDWLAEGRYSPFARYLKGYPFKDPTIGRLPERAEYLGQRGETQGTIYRVNRVAGRLNDALRKAPVEDQRATLDYLTTEGADPKSLPPSVRGAAVAAKSAIKRVGRELVRRGMLSQEAYDAHADAYLPRVYLKHLMERSGFGAGLKISDQGYLKKRTDLPEEYRDLYLGEIKDVGFLVTKAISQPSRDLAMTDFLRDLSRNPEWVLPESIVEWTAPGMERPRKVTPYWLKSEADLLRRRAGAMPDLEQRARAKEIADGMDVLADDALGAIKGVPKDFRQIPDSPRYGDLRGLVVRKEIHDDIVGAPGMWVGEKGAYDKTFDKLAKFNAFWKMMKVPFNPPTQIRNMVSNAVLLDLSGVPAQRLPLLYIRAFNEIRKNRKYYRIAVKHGIPASTFTAAELYRIRPDLLRVRGEKGGVVGRLAKMAEPIARLAKKPGDVYQFSETWGKVVKIIDAMEREGMNERDAVAAAQEALFDYSLVPNLVKSLRSRPIGAPFITFYYKAFPAVMKGAIKHPGKFAKYLIIPYLLGDALVANLNEVTTEDVDKLRKALPEWLQDQGHVYLYPYRDKSGRWDFVNFGYFLPWAMHERAMRNAMELATGSYEGRVNDFMSQLGVLGGPVPQIIAGLMTGIDPWTGREIVKDTDPPREQIYKLMMYAWRMGGPSFLTDQGVLGHMQRSLSGTPTYYGDPPLSPEQATGRAVGVNIYPVDPVQSRQRNIRRKVFEIERNLRDARRAMRNKGLGKERRDDLREQYKAKIDRLRDDLKRYREESRVHPALR